MSLHHIENLTNWRKKNTCTLVATTISTQTSRISHIFVHHHPQFDRTDTSQVFNIELENSPLEKEIPFGNHHFHVPCSGVYKRHLSEKKIASKIDRPPKKTTKTAWEKRIVLGMISFSVLTVHCLCMTPRGTIWRIAPIFVIETSRHQKRASPPPGFCKLGTWENDDFARAMCLCMFMSGYSGNNDVFCTRNRTKTHVFLFQQGKH